jgi:ribulose-phosphate 3-epimerase
MIAERNLSCAIEVDGGIAPSDAAAVVKAGARVLVAGAAIFRAAEGVAEAIRRLHASAAAA